MSEFCFPPRPVDSTPLTSTTPTTPQRLGNHSKTFTGIELPPAFLDQLQNKQPLAPNKQPLSPSKNALEKSPHRKHKHRRSGAISIDLKASAPGLVPALCPATSPTSHIPPVPDIPSNYTTAAPVPNLDSFASPLPLQNPSRSKPRVQFVEPEPANDSDSESESEPEPNTPGRQDSKTQNSKPALICDKHKKLNSWAGGSEFQLGQDLESISLSPSLTPQTDVIDLSISAPPDSPPCYDPSFQFYSSSYIDSSQLVGNPKVYSSSQSLNSAPSEPVIDLDEALSPFKTSFDLSKPGFRHRRSESAPGSMLDSSSRFQPFSKNGDNDNVIIEEEEESAPGTVSLLPPLKTTPQYFKPRRSIGSVHSETSTAVPNISPNNRPYSRNYKNMSVSAGNFLAMNTKDVSLTPVLSEHSSPAFNTNNTNNDNNNDNANTNKNTLNTNTNENEPSGAALKISFVKKANNNINENEGFDFETKESLAEDLNSFDFVVKEPKTETSEVGVDESKIRSDVPVTPQTQSTDLSPTSTATAAKPTKDKRFSFHNKVSSIFSTSTTAYTPRTSSASTLNNSSLFRRSQSEHGLVLLGGNSSRKGSIVEGGEEALQSSPSTQSIQSIHNVHNTRNNNMKRFPGSRSSHNIGLMMGSSTNSLATSIASNATVGTNNTIATSGTNMSIPRSVSCMTGLSTTSANATATGTEKKGHAKKKSRVWSWVRGRKPN